MTDKAKGKQPVNGERKRPMDNRSARFSDVDYARIVELAKREGERIGYPVSCANIIRKAVLKWLDDAEAEGDL